MTQLTEIFRSLGRRDALELRREAAELTGTQIIAREAAVPVFDPEKDYSAYPVGAPVADGGQVWTLLQPYNAAHYAGRPAELRALWSLAHTTDPARAKAWVDPLGTSGMYMQGECYRDEDGRVWRALDNNMVYPASVMPDSWEEVTV